LEYEADLINNNNEGLNINSVSACTVDGLCRLPKTDCQEYKEGSGQIHPHNGDCEKDRSKKQSRDRMRMHVQCLKASRNQLKEYIIKG
jgi:hypothetical protein